MPRPAGRPWNLRHQGRVVLDLAHEMAFDLLRRARAFLLLTSIEARRVVTGRRNKVERQALISSTTVTRQNDSPSILRRDRALIRRNSSVSTPTLRGPTRPS